MLGRDDGADYNTKAVRELLVSRAKKFLTAIQRSRRRRRLTELDQGVWPRGRDSNPDSQIQSLKQVIPFCVLLSSDSCIFIRCSGYSIMPVCRSESLDSAVRGTIASQLERMTMKIIPKTPIEANHDRETTRADLLRRAEAQGVKPFESLEDSAGDPKLTADFDVDAFLRQVREDRDRPYRSIE